MGLVRIGVDIGQKRDPTAIVVADTEERPGEAGRSAMHFLIRHLERLRLGTPYPEIARRVAEVASGARERSGNPVTIYVDATGVGDPVAELIAERWSGQVVSVYMNYGDHCKDDGDKIHLGKAHMVSRLQALLQGRRIHLPETREARVLEQELADYEIRVGENSKEQFGAFATGAHDDLATALGLAVNPRPPKYNRATW